VIEVFGVFHIGTGGTTKGPDVTLRKRRGVLAAAVAVATTLAWALPAAGDANNHDPQTTAIPIQHFVVIFQEKVSFDHYFGTYPYATNPPGRPAFHAAPHTPAVNGLTPTLLTNNPNATNPPRLDRSEALTCDQTTTTPQNKKPSTARCDIRTPSLPASTGWLRLLDFPASGCTAFDTVTRPLARVDRPPMLQAPSGRAGGNCGSWPISS
jgi:Phosphoesterase family